MKDRIKRLKDICIANGYMKFTVMPYGFPQTVESLFQNWDDFDSFTPSSKDIMRLEIERFEKIVEKWQGGVI